MNYSIKPDSGKGFTLLEILIAIFLFALVVAIVLGPSIGIIASSREAERKVDLYQTARSLMDLISADIRGLFPLPTEEGGIFFKASQEPFEGMTTVPRLDFVTTHSLVIGPRKNPFLSEVTYTLRKDLKGELFTLWRRSESPPDAPFDEGGREVPLCRMIQSFRLQFIYGDEPTTELFDQIPSAMVIEFTLSLDGEKETFVTMVRPMITLAGPGENLAGFEKTRRASDALRNNQGQQKKAR